MSYLEAWDDIESEWWRWQVSDEVRRAQERMLEELAEAAQRLDRKDGEAAGIPVRRWTE